MRPQPTAEQLLTALNQGEPLDLTRVAFNVIVDPKGELALDRGEIWVVGYDPTIGPGEAELFGCRSLRKSPARSWSTTDVHAAVSLSRLLKSDHRAGLYEWVDGEWRLVSDNLKTLSPGWWKDRYDDISAMTAVLIGDVDDTGLIRHRQARS